MQLLVNIENITTKDIIIVANNRQALTLKRQYGKINKQLPKIFNWNSLLQDLWESDDNYLAKQLITTNEIDYIFQDIIKNSAIKYSTTLITEVINSYNWHRKQQIPLTAITPRNSMQKYFLQWVAKYEFTKNKYNFIDNFDLLSVINTNQSNNYYSYGFKALTSQQQQLFTKLKVKTLIIDQSEKQFDCKIFATLEDEIDSCINWAYKLRSQNENKSIAIIVPELEKNYTYLEYGFNKIFKQNLTKTKDKYFNISLGKSLTKFNLTQDLLLILELSCQIQDNKICTKDLTKVLNSNFIANNNQFINPILRLEKDHISQQQLLKATNDSKFWLHIIDNISYKKYLNHHTWLSKFTQILNIWRFNQSRKMTSDEYQIWQKYLSSCLIFNKFSTFEKKINFKSAIAEFRTMLTKIIFQPESGTNQIQIIGLLEAEGLKFDYSWIIGVNNKVLPPPLKPLRYIPIELCKKYKIPKCAYEHTMLDAKSSIYYLSLSSKNPIISFSELDENTNLYGSPLIQWQNKDIQSIKKQNSTHNNLITVVDENVKKLNNTSINKGVKTLQNQIQCQFKGFVSRLKIDEFGLENIGFNSLQKGNILHNSLEFIYQQITTKQQLESLTEKGIATLVESGLNFAMSDFIKNGFYYNTHNEIKTKLLEFLTLELSRDDWEVVTLEKSQEINIANLSFKIRCDRVDKNNNNEVIIFDYKLGKHSSKSWCNHIKDLQLPLYAISNSVNAIYFINFKDDVKYIGMAENNEILAEKSACCDGVSWQEQLNIWQNKITKVAREFEDGKATINPIKYGCQNCNLSNFCRIKNKK